ncbi:MAG: YdeI/OmpD-associated family protein [Proteobacteria bacterium]|nr:YdeI/OmpD-associated family protein [Pseudomonadota bacterium]
MKPEYYAKDAAEWRGWLAENHASESEVWRVFMKKQYIGWIASAKRVETRARRLSKALKMLKSKQKLGMV